MKRAARAGLLLAALAAAAGCGGSIGPAPVDAAHDQCSFCRMVVSEPRFAAQVDAPGEEPRFYDDLRCLRDGLAATPPPRGARVFVADVRTGAWTPAGGAVFARVSSMATPMASHWVAWADDASRRRDPEGAAAELLSRSAILGSAGEASADPATPGGEDRP